MTLWNLQRTMLTPCFECDRVVRPGVRPVWPVQRLDKQCDTSDQQVPRHDTWQAVTRMINHQDLITLCHTLLGFIKLFCHSLSGYHYTALLWSDTLCCTLTHFIMLSHSFSCYIYALGYLHALSHFFHHPITPNQIYHALLCAITFYYTITHSITTLHCQIYENVLHLYILNHTLPFSITLYHTSLHFYMT